MSTNDEDALVRAVLDQYAISYNGNHGVSHWARVLENGVRLADRTGADVELVRLFALLHDSTRQNELDDPDHGPRSVELVLELHGRLFTLDDSRLELLIRACRHHTDGVDDPDVTVQTCWDADRLDLGRVCITPDPARLLTAAARDSELLAWANTRAERRVTPPMVRGWLF